MSAAPTGPAPGDAAAAGERPTARGANVSRVYDALRALIVHGRLAPGARIVETDVVARLGVSRTPVRSALQRLQHEGYVAAVERAKEPRLVVAPLSAEDGRELFAVLGALETLAARAAAALPAAERGRLVAALQASNDAFRRASAPAHPDPARRYAHDAEFHQHVIDAGAGPRVRALVGAARPQAERYIRHYIPGLPARVSPGVAEHEAIVAALAAGDADGAAHAVTRHWAQAAGRMAGVMARTGAVGAW